MKRIKRFFRELFRMNREVVTLGDNEVTLENVYGSTVKVEINGKSVEMLTNKEGKIIHTIHHDNN